MKNDIWQALSYVYLKDGELQYYGVSESRKKVVNLIKDRLFKDAWSRMYKCGERNPPFINNFKSKFLSIDRKVKVFQVIGINGAKMELGDNSFRIYINERCSFREKRTLVAHEVGHTFLYDVDKIPIKPYLDTTTADIIKRSDKGDLYKIEGFIYEIGRNILIPSPILEKEITRNPTIEDFLDACNKFNVTKDVMIRRLFWDVHDINGGSNYWPNSAMIMYPIGKISKGVIPKPYGNSEIFRGSFFKNYDMRIAWNHLILIIKYCLNNPKDKIKSNEFYEKFNVTKLSYRGNILRTEIAYIPDTFSLFLLINRYPESPRNQTLQN